MYSCLTIIIFKFSSTDIIFLLSVKLYAESLARFQGNSPYIYPMYGLGELPQVCFSPVTLRKCLELL